MSPLCHRGHGSLNSEPRTPRSQASPGARLSRLLEAPHRLAFFTGLAGLTVSGLWWAAEVLGRYAALWSMPVPALPGVFAHAGLMLYGVLPAFMAGFLLTAAPRWMAVPPVGRTVYATTSLSLGAGMLVWLLGQYQTTAWLVAGAGLLGFGWAMLAASVFRLLLQATQPVVHAWVIAVALSVGALGALLLGAGVARGDGMLQHFAVRVGLWGAVLPVFFAVCHRMLPFFAQAALPGYQPFGPVWVLLAVTGLLYARIALGVGGWFGLLALADALLLSLTLWLGLRWRPLAGRGIPLLWTLFAAYLWLPVGLGLQTARDLVFLLTGEWVLGRAPVHALAMGFMAGLMMAMVTRVTLGHSGRPLRMQNLTLGCFLVLQLATLGRLTSELPRAPGGFRVWLAASILLWLLATLPWAASHLPVYLRARVDGNPG